MKQIVQRAGAHENTVLKPVSHVTPFKAKAWRKPGPNLTSTYFNTRTDPREFLRHPCFQFGSNAFETHYLTAKESFALKAFLRQAALASQRARHRCGTDILLRSKDRIKQPSAGAIVSDSRAVKREQAMKLNFFCRMAIYCIGAAGDRNQRAYLLEPPEYGRSNGGDV